MKLKHHDGKVRSYGLETKNLRIVNLKTVKNANFLIKTSNE